VRALNNPRGRSSSPFEDRSRSVRVATFLKVDAGSSVIPFEEKSTYFSELRPWNAAEDIVLMELDLKVRLVR